MITQTLEDRIEAIDQMTKQLQQDMSKHGSAHDLLPEIRDIRRQLAAIEEGIINETSPQHGDAC